MANAKMPKRPTSDEFVLEELGNQLTEAYQEKLTIVLTVWGWEVPVRGQIVTMDSRTGKVLDCCCKHEREWLDCQQ